MATFKTASLMGGGNNNEEEMGNQIADKNWYLDEDRQLTDDESKAAFRLVNEGQEIDADMAAKYDFSGKVTPKSKAADVEAESDNASDGAKAMKAPANKSAKAAKNKGAK